MEQKIKKCDSKEKPRLTITPETNKIYFLLGDLAPSLEEGIYTGITSSGAHRFISLKSKERVAFYDTISGECSLISYSRGKDNPGYSYHAIPVLFRGYIERKSEAEFAKSRIKAVMRKH
ncbi:hypothetical protein J4461_04660 [Candidatus Pacearchaeota archaeon]|nr:hypothetical protein [Candidatus Pacearchaeota archaeon]